MMLKKKLQTLFFILKKSWVIKKKLILVESVLSITSLCVSLFAIYAPSLILNLITTENSMEKVIFRLTILLISIALLKLLVSYFNRLCTIYQEEVNNEILRSLDYEMLSVRYRWIESPQFIDQFNKAIFPISNYNVIKILFSAFPKVIQGIILILSVIFILLALKPIIVLIVLSLSIIVFFLTRYMMKLEIDEANISLKKNKEFLYYLTITHDPIISKDIRIYQAQPFFMRKIRSLFNEYIQSGYKLYGARNMRIVISVGASIILLITLYTYLLITELGDISASLLLLLINAATSLSQSINSISDELLKINENLVYLYEYYKFEKMVADESLSGDYILNEEIKSIEFKKVCFSYPNTATEVLKGVSFTLDNTCTLSIVGRNGSGKTTMIKLLTRLYEPTSGQILINGIPLDQIDYNSYINKLSVVFQDFATFNFTMRDNIEITNHDESRLNHALKESEFDKEINKFPCGIDTFITKTFADDGVTLSTGQTQKLAIARAIYRKASVMILDEPTASLDPLAEEEVYRHFKKITKDNLSIYISHRLSSCKYADKIIVLEDGIIAEEGNHDKLMKQRGHYYEMFRIQGNKYQDI